MSDELKLLVEWSNPWEEFRTAIRPALSRSETPLAGEAHTGLWPFRGMAGAWLAEVCFLILIVFLPAKYATLHPNGPSAPPKYDVLYYFAGDELPQTRDLGGARAGKSGRAGGKEAFHRSQTIRVARGESVVEKVVDAPDLKLPFSTAPVANVIALPRPPGPAPAEGLRPSRTPPTFSKDAIVAPPPQVLRRLAPSTPTLPSSVIAPPPSKLASNRQLPGLSTNVVAPPPSDVSADRRAPTTELAANIIAPAPTTNIARQYPNVVVPMDTPIIPPSPRDVRRDAPALTGPVAQKVIVVPPPVSAPERGSTPNAKLTLPAPAVIGPPPSQVMRDQHSVNGIALGDPRKVVPPPASAPDQVAQHIPGAVMGTAQIIPPPPSFGGGSSLSGAGGGRANQHGVSGGTVGAADVIPPPPSVGGAGSLSGAGRNQGSGLTGSLGSSPVPPPPNATGGAGSGSASGRTFAGLGGGTVVPPPPNAASGAFSGRGTGNQGSGLGGLMDVGSVTAPASGGGGANGGKGVVISASPGSALGKPGSGGAGALAMSPAGGNQPGLGGNGGGNGIGHGDGPGSGLHGEGSGAAKEGTGRGSDPNARGGISPYPGPGGAGSATEGQPAVPGVSVEGGHIVNLPSFGDGGNSPNAPGHSGMGPGGKGSLDVTVVATARAGGAFNNYGQFKADKVYTKYLDTAAGRVSMQYFDATSAAHPYAETLTDPVPIRMDLPTRLGRARLLIACILDRTGILRDLRVYEGGTPDMTSKVMAALPSWKFRPAFHGETPIDVTVMLGFNIDTN